MTTKQISINVGGLWRTHVDISEETTWKELKILICNMTAIWPQFQCLVPNNNNDTNAYCELEDGDEVFCNWELYFGYHPLHLAAYCDDINVIRSWKHNMLCFCFFRSWIASGASIDEISNTNATPLINASKYINEKCVAEMLRLGANARHTDINGNTALHYIAYDLIFHLNSKEQIKNVVTMLIASGCDPTLRNKDGLTCLDFLQKYEHEQIVIEFKEWINFATS